MKTKKVEAAEIEAIKQERIEIIKNIILENGLEKFSAQEVANIYQLIRHYANI